jgi:class 3 adenylate cyclase
MNQEIIELSVGDGIAIPSHRESANLKDIMPAFVPDEILAVFGSPEPDAKQHEKAVRAAWDMQTAMNALNIERISGGRSSVRSASASIVARSCTASLAQRSASSLQSSAMPSIAPPVTAMAQVPARC